MRWTTEFMHANGIEFRKCPKGHDWQVLMNRGWMCSECKSLAGKKGGAVKPKRSKPK